MSATDAISNERLDALLRGDRPRTSGEERRAALLDGLRSARLQAPEALRSRVLATKPARSRVPRFALPSRRLVFVLVPAAAVLAVGAALVHGLVGSSGKTDRPLAVASQAQPKTWRAAGAGGAATGSTELLPRRRRRAGSSTPPRRSSVRVPDVDTLSQATSARDEDRDLARRLRAVRRLLDAATGGGSSCIELRIPAQNVKTALARLAALGTLVSQQVSVQDLQHAFAVQTAQIAQLRRVGRGAPARVARSGAARRAAGAAPDPARRAAARARAAAARANGHGRRRHDGAHLARARTRRMPSSRCRTHRGRLGRMVHSAVGFLALEATIALYALIVIGPFALLAAPRLGADRARRRRDERRLLAT